MRRIALFIISMLSTAMIALTSCTDEEYSSDGSLRLSFSTDTLSFDTIMNGMLSPIKTLKIYNHTNYNVRIQSIAHNSSYDYFRINIDGKSADVRHDLEILSGDSLHVFVQTLRDDESDLPFALLDSISVSYNGHTDIIYLSAFTETPIILDDYTITSDTMLTAGRPFFIRDTLRVAEGAKLILDEGTRLFFANGSSIVIDGALEAYGTSEHQVKLRYFRSDDMYSGMPYYYAPGNWGGIFISDKASNCLFLHTQIIGGTYGIVVDSSAVDSKMIVIGNSELITAKYGTLVSKNAKIYAFNSVFANGGIYNVRLIGGNYNFLHCTIASDFTEANKVRHATLYVTDKDGSNTVPLTCNIANSIIYDKNRNAIESETALKKLPTETHKMAIFNSLVSEKIAETEYFYENVYSDKVLFGKDKEPYTFDYSIDSLSAARTIANPAYYTEYTECKTDIRGHSREDKYYPDAGAYEY